MNSRGVVSRPLAMGRPARPIGEAALVREALAAMPAHLQSTRSRAACLARRVVVEILAADRREAFEEALVDLAFAVARDPVRPLARQFAGELERERLRCFEARGCRQIDATAWAAETLEIAVDLEKRLAEKFRRA